MKSFLTCLITVTFLVLWGCEGDPGSKRGAGVLGSSDSDSASDGTNGSGVGDTTVGGSGDSDTQELLEPICDEVTGECVCLNVAVIGTSDSGANDVDKDVTAFVDWLNNKSSAHVTMFTGRQTLTDEFLSGFHLIIFQLQGDSKDGPFWTYSADEVAAVTRWLEAGAGMITLTGYNGNVAAAETDALNSLLEPVSGISYNADDYLGNCPGGETCYCWGNTIPIRGWDTNHDVAHEITAVGAFHGYSINAPADAQIIATQDGGGITNNAVVGKEVGKGRVLAFNDEWIIFSNQWLGPQDTSSLGNADPNNPCFDGTLNDFLTANNVFQVAQLWYNMIYWTAPENECFTIDEPVIVPII